jgi:hypothetical protein
VAALGHFTFAHTGDDYVIVLNNASFVPSDANCEAPLPKFARGDYFFMP